MTAPEALAAFSEIRQHRRPRPNEVSASCRHFSPGGRCQRVNSPHYATLVPPMGTCQKWEASSTHVEFSQPKADYARIEIRDGVRGSCNVVLVQREGRETLLGTSLSPANAFRCARQYGLAHGLPAINAGRSK